MTPARVCVLTTTTYHALSPSGTHPDVPSERASSRSRRMLLLQAVLVPSLLRSAVHPRMAAAAGVSASPPPPPAIGGDELALGFDFGTSGARCAVVDASGAVVCEPAAYAWGSDQERTQTAEAWVDALHSLLDALPAELCVRVRRIAVSGTSSSVVLCDRRDGTPAAGRGLPRMYDFSVSKQAAAGAGDAALQLIGEHAPAKHTVPPPKPGRARSKPCPQPGLGPSPSPSLSPSPSPSQGPSPAARSPRPDPSLTLTRCARPPLRWPSSSPGMPRRDPGLGLGLDLQLPVRPGLAWDASGSRGMPRRDPPEKG